MPQTIIDEAKRERTGVLWTREHRTTTVGSLLVITLLAFENMGVGTAMPTIVAALDGGSLYAWPFVTFLIASMLSTVLSGRLCDRRGPTVSLLVGPGLFIAGLLLAGLAPNMGALLAGRALQGLGTGTVIVAVKLLIALVYNDRERPVMYAANAAAWILPALVGPAVAGVVTDTLGWRWVFLGLVPVALIAVGLLVSVTRGLGPHTADDGARRAGILPAVLAVLGVATVTWAAQHPSLAALAYGAAGVLALAFALRGLLPVGTLTGRGGLPGVVASQALLGGAFASVEAYLPLTMSSVHGYSPALAGLPLTVSALGWSAASALQGRFPDWSRERLLRVGFLLVTAGLALFGVVGQSWVPGWLVFAAALVAGGGMGIAFPSVTLLLMRLSPRAERGFNTSAAQIGDTTAQSLVIGLGGVLLGTLATTTDPSAAITTLALAMAGVTALGALRARR